MERPDNTIAVFIQLPYVGIGQQVQRVRFCLLNYVVVPLLFNIILFLCEFVKSAVQSGFASKSYS